MEITMNKIVIAILLIIVAVIVILLITSGIHPTQNLMNNVSNLTNVSIS